eukprot:TRINITY_DN39195_c0_g1_i3.p1 TRINITY_DN39195_c0_g1~~TRINITY_DN39195_c0_g1_i3.p1  ORF type:complete len:431 (-),score=60.77 TRINITY_DN39195_c0_g1_i3:71-1363(-)
MRGLRNLVANRMENRFTSNQRNNLRSRLQHINSVHHRNHMWMVNKLKETDNNVQVQVNIFKYNQVRVTNSYKILNKKLYLQTSSNEYKQMQTTNRTSMSDTNIQLNNNNNICKYNLTIHKHRHLKAVKENVVQVKITIVDNLKQNNKNIKLQEESKKIDTTEGRQRKRCRVKIENVQKWKWRRVSVYLSPTDVQGLIDVVRLAKEMGNSEFVRIVKKMRREHAFLYGAVERPRNGEIYRWGNKFNMLFPKQQQSENQMMKEFQEHLVQVQESLNRTGEDLEAEAEEYLSRRDHLLKTDFNYSDDQLEKITLLRPRMLQKYSQELQNFKEEMWDKIESSRKVNRPLLRKSQEEDEEEEEEEEIGNLSELQLQSIGSGCEVIDLTAKSAGIGLGVFEGTEIGKRIKAVERKEKQRNQVIITAVRAWMDSINQ